MNETCDSSFNDSISQSQRRPYQARMHACTLQYRQSAVLCMYGSGSGTGDTAVHGYNIEQTITMLYGVLVSFNNKSSQSQHQW